MQVMHSVWWPAVSSHVQQFVEDCRKCAKQAKPRKDPLLPMPLPDYPWQVMGTDLCELNGVQYLVVVDYFSIMWKFLRRNQLPQVLS